MWTKKLKLQKSAKSISISGRNKKGKLKNWNEAFLRSRGLPREPDDQKQDEDDEQHDDCNYELLFPCCLLNSCVNFNPSWLKATWCSRAWRSCVFPDCMSTTAVSIFCSIESEMEISLVRRKHQQETIKRGYEQSGQRYWPAFFKDFFETTFKGMRLSIPSVLFSN